MAEKLASAYVEIATEQKKLDAGLSAAKKKVEKATSDMSKSGGMLAFGKNIWGMAVGATAALGLANTIQKIADAEKEAARFRATLKATGNDAKNNTERLQDYADTLKEAFGFDDGDVKEGMMTALTNGVPADRMEEFMRLAAGLGVVMGTDVKGGAEALTKAYNGNLAALEKQLPVLKKYKTEQEKIEAVTRLANVGLAQQVATMDTAAGSVQRLKLAWDDFQKTSVFGKFLTRDAPDLAAQALKHANGDKATWQATAAGIARLFGAVLPGELGKQFDQAAEYMDEKVGESMAESVQKANEQANAAAKGIGDELKKALEDANKEAEKSTDIFSKLSDVYKDAQRAAIKGSPVAGLGTAPPVNPKPFGDVGFKGDAPAAAGPDHRPEWMKRRDELYALRAKAATGDKGAIEALKAREREDLMRGRPPGVPGPGGIRERLMSQYGDALYDSLHLNPQDAARGNSPSAEQRRLERADRLRGVYRDAAEQMAHEGQVPHMAEYPDPASEIGLAQRLARANARRKAADARRAADARGAALQAGPGGSGIAAGMTVDQLAKAVASGVTEAMGRAPGAKTPDAGAAAILEQLKTMNRNLATVGTLAK